MLPYEPLDGQMIALQLRLLRGARAVLDPMLNLGLIDREIERRVLEEEVGVLPAMAKQELDRYMFNAPGQHGSYFRLEEPTSELQSIMRILSAFFCLTIHMFLISSRHP